MVQQKLLIQFSYIHIHLIFLFIALAGWFERILLTFADKVKKKTIKHGFLNAAFLSIHIDNHCSQTVVIRQADDDIAAAPQILKKSECIYHRDYQRYIKTILGVLHAVFCIV